MKKVLLAFLFISSASFAMGQNTKATSTNTKVVPTSKTPVELNFAKILAAKQIDNNKQVISTQAAEQTVVLTKRN